MFLLSRSYCARHTAAGASPRACGATTAGLTVLIKASAAAFTGRAAWYSTRAKVYCAAVFDYMEELQNQASPPDPQKMLLASVLCDGPAGQPLKRKPAFMLSVLENLLQGRTLAAAGARSLLNLLSNTHRGKSQRPQLLVQYAKLRLVRFLT